MDCITVLPLNFNYEEINIMIYPTVLKDESGLTLVDCGYPMFLPIIESSMEQAGLQMSKLARIVITHHDHDHMGALKEITDKYPDIEIISSKVQKPYITGKAKSLRLIQAEEQDQFLTDDEKIESKKFMDMMRSVQTVDRVTTFADGQIIPVCGGVEIVDTSGHMPGHISLYVPKEKTLIAGDALVVEDGSLCIANPEYVLDMTGAVESVKKLLNYDIERVICYHGGVYSADVKSSLERIITEYDVAF